MAITVALSVLLIIPILTLSQYLQCQYFGTVQGAVSIVNNINTDTVAVRDDA